MSGILGLSLNTSCLEDVKRSAPLQQHLGDEWGGFSIIENNKILTKIEKRAKIKLLLDREELRIKEAQAKRIIVSTSRKDPQPVTIEDTPLGPISLIWSGKITNREELQKKSPYLVGTDGEIYIRLIAEGRNPLEGLKNIYDKAKGPFCLNLFTRDGIFAARDRLGIGSLISGRFLEEEKIGCGVACESIPLEHIGMEIERDIRPAEIIEIGEKGFRVLENMGSPGLIICGFIFGYWARPSSIIENIWIGLSRYVAGMKLGPFCPEVDIIADFPMSGITAGQGLSYTTGIPYRAVFDYNSEAGGRSFLPYDIEVRTGRAKDKLLVMKWAVKDFSKIDWTQIQCLDLDEINGAIVAIVDDSIVEGNQTIARINTIKRAGAKETHLLIETPEMKYPCPFDVTKRGALLAAIHSNEERRKILGVKTLTHNSVSDYALSIIPIQSKERHEKNPITIKNICLGCFTGEFPKY